MTLARAATRKENYGKTNRFALWHFFQIEAECKLHEMTCKLLVNTILQILMSRVIITFLDMMHHMLHCTVTPVTVFLLSE